MGRALTFNALRKEGRCIRRLLARATPTVVLIRTYTHIGRTKRLHLHKVRFESNHRRNTPYGRGKSSLAY
jgi:hypothetical protein